MAVSPLPPVLVSLVHHVELNKAGWWDKALQQVLLATLWLDGDVETRDDLVASVQETFSIRVERSRVDRQVDALRESGAIMSLPDSRLKISEERLRHLEQDLKQAEENEKAAKKLFIENIKRSCPSIEPEECWQFFNDDCLVPLVQALGAKTYELLSGTPQEIEASIRTPKFFNRYPLELAQPLRASIVSFLDPKKLTVRSYVLRTLNAYFFVEAISLRPETLEALHDRRRRPVAFAVFLDTNFLFSVLDLHDNPSNEAAHALLGLMRSTARHISSTLYVFPLTADEFRRVIVAKRESFKGLRLPANLADTAEKGLLDGVALRFVRAIKETGSAIDAESFFGPYLRNFSSILRGKGVELYNEKIDRYLTRQDVVDDIMARFEAENPPPSERHRRYKALEHDTVLRQFVLDKRPTQTESPLDAKYWVVTLDFSLLRFDRQKTRDASQNVPVCLHPTDLIHMLQFFEPRTTQFEETMIGSMRLPFIFQEFDSVAERVTIRILTSLSRFQNVGDLSSETVAEILTSDALRGRMASADDPDEQMTAVQEEILAHDARLREKLEAEQETSKQLSDASDEQAGALGAIQEQLTEQQRVDAELRRELEQAKTERQARQQLGRFILNWLVLPVALASLVTWRLALALSDYAALGALESYLISGLALLLAWMALVEWQGKKSSAVEALTIFARFRRVRRWLYGALAVVMAGVVSNAMWDWIAAFS